MRFWGQHQILDLNGCPRSLIANRDNIHAWLEALIEAIDMKAYGDPIIEHFATHSDVTAGYSAIQLIETSNIAAHFAEELGQVYIDIFSCKEYDNDVAEAICVKYFEPKQANIIPFMRGDFTNPTKSYA